MEFNRDLTRAVGEADGNGVKVLGGEELETLVGRK